MKSTETEPVDFPSSVELILSGDPDGLFNAANDLRQISTSEAVEVLYRLAIEQGVKEAYLNYGALLRDINRPMEALVAVREAHEVGDPKAAFALGEMNWAMERYADAIKWLRLAGSNPLVPLRLARWYRALGDEVSAVKVLREGSETSAEAAVEYIHTSNELDLESAINLLEKHLQNGEVDVLIVLADLYSKRAIRRRRLNSCDAASRKANLTHCITSASPSGSPGTRGKARRS